MLLKYKLVVFVPVDHADKVREAIGQAGGGQIGKYSFCSYSSLGFGRFLPGEGANPAIGKVGKLEQVQEERIEVLCDAKIVDDIIIAMKKAHPYEEVAYDLYPLESRS